MATATPRDGLARPARHRLRRARVRPRAGDDELRPRGGLGTRRRAGSRVQDAPRRRRGVGLAVGVVPVSGSLDLKALAAAVGGKRAEMAKPDVAERKTGYVVGGISPIGQKTPLPTVVDEFAELWDTVFVSGGRRGFDVELAPRDLIRATGGTFAPIAK